MLSLNRILLFFTLLFIGLGAQAQLQIVPQTQAQALAQKLVGGGVTISNVTMQASPLATGFFYNQGSTQIGLDSGIVLSTGRVLTGGGFTGLNGAQSAQANSGLNFGGDPDLSTMVPTGITRDAVVLEFDFVPLGDSIKFRYVFSSDEYPVYNCTNFNDVFAFFISGPGIGGAPNIALVPGTNIPVAINSVNSGTPGTQGNIINCNSMGAGSPFTQYYVANTGSSFFTHNGHTRIFTAAARVTPCQTYHLKIAIADAQDFSFDSGVFLEAGSLQSDPVRIVSSLPVINGMPYLVEGCVPGDIKIVRSRKSPVPQPVNLTFGGSAINGVDVNLIPATVTIPANDSVLLVPITPIIDNLPEAPEVLKIYISNGCALSNNYYLDSILIQLRDYDTLSVSPRQVSVCNGASVQLTATGNFPVFQWSPSAGLNNPSTANPVVTPLDNGVYHVTAGVGTCQARDSVVVTVKKLDFISKRDINCANGNTGQIKVSGGWEWRPPVRYSIGTGAWQSDSTFSNLTAGNYVVRVKDSTGCIDSMTVNLVQAFPTLTLSDSTISAACNGTNGRILLQPAGGAAPYIFLLDGNDVTGLTHSVNSGAHSLILTDSNGCTVSRNYTIATDPPIRFTTTPSQVLCNGSADGFIYVQAQGGSGNYQYSLDGTNFQAADSFFVYQPSYTIQVRDEKGCTASQQVNIPINQAVFINLGADTTICEGSRVQFQPSYNAVTFTWTASPTLSATNIANPYAAPTATTTYFVMVTKDVCVARDTITVNVWAAPVPDAGIDSSICYGKTIQLQGSGGATYQWSPASAVSDAGAQQPSVRPLLQTSFYLRVFDIHGCPSLRQDTVRVSVVPGIQAFAGRDTMVASGQPLQLVGRELSNGGTTIFQWSPARGLNNPSILNPVATLDKDITYTLTMTTPEGCTGSDLVNIKVFQAPEIYVPSAFTPNGDGLNDRLYPIPVGMKEFRYFRVYNRWGQIVFQSANAAQGWDARINGVNQPTGTFVWMAEGVDYKGNVVRRNGTTTLIR